MFNNLMMIIPNCFKSNFAGWYSSTSYQQCDFTGWNWRENSSGREHPGFIAVECYSYWERVDRQFIIPLRSREHWWSLRKWPFEARTCKLSLINVIMVKLIRKPKGGEAEELRELPSCLKATHFSVVVTRDWTHLDYEAGDFGSSFKIFLRITF